MRTIRTFVAVPLSNEVGHEVRQLVGRLRQPNDGIRWVPPANLHLTLKFLGDVENTDVPAVCQVVRDVCSENDPFELTFGGTGTLPSLRRPRVLYAGVEDSSGTLRAIVADLEQAFAELGFKPEPRDYTPHLTLGRGSRGNRRVSAEAIERLQREDDVELGVMIAEEVHVIASFLDKQGPTYQVMDRVDL